MVIQYFIISSEKSSQITYTDPRLAFSEVSSNDMENITKYSSRNRELGSSSTTIDVLCNLDLHEKVALITGANSGIGFETAKALASCGTHVILACRNAEKARQCIKDIVSTYVSESSVNYIISTSLILKLSFY